jgi:hypothetical protein
MGRRARAVGLLTVILLPLAAAAQPRPADPPTVTIPTLDDAAIGAWSEKLDRYATVHTRTIRAWSNILRYTAALGLREWRTTGPRDAPPLLNLDADGFAAAARLARELAPAAPAMREVDRAATPFADALERLPAAFNDAVAYYGSSHQYETDNFARGPALHARITAAVEPYLATHRPFLFQVNQARSALDRQEMAMLERLGDRGLAWHMRRLLRAALEATAHLPTYGRRDSQIDLTSFDAAIRRYAELVEAWRASPEKARAVERTRADPRCPRPDVDAPERFVVTLRDWREAYVKRQQVPVLWELRVRDSMMDYHDFWAKTLVAVQYDRACGARPAEAGGQADPTGRR